MLCLDAGGRGSGASGANRGACRALSNHGWDGMTEPSVHTMPASSITTDWMPTAFGPSRLLCAGRPEAPTVILLHGYAAAADQWRPLMDRLAADYRLLAPDLLGFGEAPTPPPPYTVERWLAQL